MRLDGGLGLLGAVPAVLIGACALLSAPSQVADQESLSVGVLLLFAWAPWAGVVLLRRRPRRAGNGGGGSWWLPR